MCVRARAGVGVDVGLLKHRVHTYSRARNVQHVATGSLREKDGSPPWLPSEEAPRLNLAPTTEDAIERTFLL